MDSPKEGGESHRLQNISDLLSDIWVEPIFLAVPLDVVQKMWYLGCFLSGSGGQEGNSFIREPIGKCLLWFFTSVTMSLLKYNSEINLIFLNRL